MGKRDIVYGLGENVGGINKRGSLYESFCSDDFDHTPDKSSLYAAHNFILIDGDKQIGLFFDYPGKIAFDIGYTHKDILSITSEKSNIDIYIIEGDNLLHIVQKFRNAIGQSYVPPKWAFGFQQSRWSYPNDKSITEVADNFRRNKIPCDAIYMDIDYMEDYKNFTIDKTKFPNFPNFVKEMKNKGFRLVPIIDAGCKKEDGYDICEEGLENNYYCVDKNGKPFVGAVWPGKVHFPDFLNPDTREWFGDKYSGLIEQGIEGFWNDMNEPAIFYSEDGLQKAFDKIEDIKGQNLDIYSFFDLKSTMLSISNSMDDYKSFYHNVDGEMVNHYDVHNLYGYNMTRAASDSFSSNYPDKRFLLFSRASYVGMHRYGGIWTGDNKSWWEHLELSIKMMPSLNMVGFLYSGADVGGFGCNSNSELVTRWTQFGIFTPLLRNHAALGTRLQEPFSFDSETTDILRNTLNFRYALIPYIYSEFMKSSKTGDMYIKPLSFEYRDEISRRVEDQLLVGDSLMVAPIYKANTFGRNVWLPEDMLLWKVNKYNNIEGLKIAPSGFNYIDVDIDEIPLFIKRDRILILGEHGENVAAINSDEITLIAFVDNCATYKLYDDDGETNQYKAGIFSELIITISKRDDELFNIETKTNGLSKIKKINYNIVTNKGRVLSGIKTI
ncbi:DUF5110 domain-containing protein [Thiospirochaeta perfilievii]|uniref:DUF5110 domain-containing protein n=2 Tax=Thiospirochaeta perfilievii TaxID=252967 RepID=A0A5C1QIK0_9SPIO|nr:DUF5110 domain-containing protein [Thiospirochaeta perfilievii]